MPGAAARADLPASRRIVGSRPFLAVATALSLAIVVGVWVYGSASFLSEGLHLDRLRGAHGATTVTLHVTRTHTAYCGRGGCTYTSVGSYVSPWTGAPVTDVRAVPAFDRPALGPLRVIVSPGHRHEAVRADYTGAGDLGAGIAVLAVGSIVPLGLLTWFVRVRRRRWRVRRTLDAVGHGAAPAARFRGVLRGAGINPLVGVSDIELTPDALIELESRIGGDVRFTVALTDVTAIETDLPPEADLPVPPAWRGVRFHTPRGSFTLTCDAAYGPLLRAALERHRAGSPAATQES